MNRRLLNGKRNIIKMKKPLRLWSGFFILKFSRKDVCYFCFSNMSAIFYHTLSYITSNAARFFISSIHSFLSSSSNSQRGPIKSLWIEDTPQYSKIPFFNCTSPLDLYISSYSSMDKSPAVVIILPVFPFNNPSLSPSLLCLKVIPGRKAFQFSCWKA